MRVREKAAYVVERLFARLREDPDRLPAEWRARDGAGGDEAVQARLVCDYIAGMTDRYALAEYRRLFDDAIDLR